MGTKCYQTIDQYESIKCVYPKDLVASSSSASSTETDTSSSSSGISVLLGARSAFKSQDELGQTDLGFHNNRFAQVPLESILSSLSLSVTPAAEDRMQTTIPTSSEPRVISVNIVLPTFAIKITEDPNVLSVATVLSIDPNAETTTASTSASASETQALDLSEDNAGIAKDSFFLTVDNSDFSSLSTAQGNTTPETPTTSAAAAAAAAAAAMGAAAITATATTTVTTTAEKAKLLVSTTKPIPIFGTPDVATRKALGRLALEMATPWVTAAATDDQEFTQSIVTRAANKNRANSRQRHEITIDDYDLAGILRMTNLASLASQLLLSSSGVYDLAAFDQPMLPSAPSGPVFSVPQLAAIPYPGPHIQQVASEINPALVLQNPTAARPPAMPISSSPFNIMPPVNTRASPPTLASLPPNSIVPLIMQDTNTAIYTPIIPFITDGTRRETPTPHADSANRPNGPNGGINASGIASILQDVFHIPPSAISIDGKPLAAGGPGSSGKGNRKDHDSDSDDDGDNEENSDSEDAGSDVQGEPQDLEKELESRLGIEMNRNRNRDRFRAHIKIVGASIKNKGRHVDFVKDFPKGKVQNRFRGAIKGKSKNKHRGSTLMAVDSDSDSSDDETSSENPSHNMLSQISATDGSFIAIDGVEGTRTTISDSESSTAADTNQINASMSISTSARAFTDNTDDQGSKFEMIIEDDTNSSSIG
ncbi:hypothetical protein LPJ64_003351 [Coemansia asiatica]|uniref:Uncharacterized protein n=1 Tax=Coemansia asiatica TaxID=1052880 RepID=A0A9W7XKF2_9FUNG|nr:hypothetical protein LPJ64_003351 [Coemansia asiatica]